MPEPRSLVVKYSWKTLSRTSGGMPGPLSAISTATISPARSTFSRRSPPSSFHGLQGVRDQVQDGLLQQVRIAAHQGGLGRRFEMHLHSRGAGLRSHQIRDLPCQRPQIDVREANFQGTRLLFSECDREQSWKAESPEGREEPVGFAPWARRPPARGPPQVRSLGGPRAGGLLAHGRTRPAPPLPPAELPTSGLCWPSRSENSETRPSRGVVRLLEQGFPTRGGSGRSFGSSRRCSPSMR